MNENWKEILSQNSLPIIDKEKKQQSIEKLKAEIIKTEIKIKENYFQKIKRYIPYMSKTSFPIQIILLILGICIIKLMTFEKTRLMLSLVMPILAFLQVIELEKSFKYKMYEIEMSCKVNLKEIISIKLIISTAVDVCIMTIFAIMTGTKFEYDIYLLIIYFLVPFLVTNSINIGLIKTLKSSFNEIINITTMIFINIICLILNIKYPNVYEVSSILVWVVILFITIGYLIKSIYQLYKNEEDYIWNLK